MVEASNCVLMVRTGICMGEIEWFMRDDADIFEVGFDGVDGDFELGIWSLSVDVHVGIGYHGANVAGKFGGTGKLLEELEGDLRNGRMDTGELEATKDFGVTGGDIIEGRALANRDEEEIFFEIVRGNDGTELRIHVFDELFEEDNAVFDRIRAVVTLVTEDHS